MERVTALASRNSNPETEHPEHSRLSKGIKGRQ
jgi:hypothetical protein